MSTYVLDITVNIAVLRHLLNCLTGPVGVSALDLRFFNSPPQPGMSIQVVL